MKAKWSPSIFTLLLFVALVILNVLSLYLGFLLLLSWIIEGSIFVLMIIDYLISRRISLSFKINAPNIIRVGHVFNLGINFHSDHIRQAEVLFHLGEYFQGQEAKKLKANEEGNWELKSNNRTQVNLNNLYFKFRSKLKLFQIIRTYRLNHDISIIPDENLGKRALKSQLSKYMSQNGSHKFYQFSMGNELKGIRDYEQGDALRDIDWKTSARIGKPYTKIYQAETDIPVIILLDCGRLLSETRDEGSVFDMAIGATIELAQQAIISGDKFRVIAFADRIIGDLKLEGHKSSLPVLYTFLSKLKALSVHSHFNIAFEYLLTKIKKHGLVFCISDIHTAKSAQELIHIARPLLKYFKINILLIQDHAFDKILLPEQNIDSVDALWDRHAAIKLYNDRKEAIRALNSFGIKAINTSERYMAAILLEKYAQWKAGL